MSEAAEIELEVKRNGTGNGNGTGNADEDQDEKEELELEELERIEQKNQSQLSQSHQQQSQQQQQQQQQPSIIADHNTEPSITINLNNNNEAYISALDLLDESKGVSLHEIRDWNEQKRKDFVKHFPLSKIKDFLTLLRNQGLREEAVSMKFRGLSYTKDNKKLLDNVSGYLNPGMLMCIIGANSTPLLEVLAGRQIGGEVTGEYLLNNARPPSNLKRIISFVPKEDVHLAVMTVREVCLFSARLRNPRQRYSDELKQVMVDLVLKMMGLTHCADTIVGDDSTLRGISGGEKRRLSIAVEIVAGHSVVIADQPTNGLDSSSALRFVKNAKRSARAGICAIHSIMQPSPELFFSYDLVMLMSKGICIYFGAPSEALNYFESIGFNRPNEKSIPDFLEALTKTPERFFTNKVVKAPVQQDELKITLEETLALPEETEEQIQYKQMRLLQISRSNTDFTAQPISQPVQRQIQSPKSQSYVQNGRQDSASNFSRVADPKVRAKLRKEAKEKEKEERAKCFVYLSKKFAESKHKRALDDVLDNKQVEVKAEVANKQKASPSSSSSSVYLTALWYQTLLLIHRQFQLTSRDKAVTIGGIMRAIVMGLLLGSIFWQLNHSQGGAQSRIGLLFYVLAFNATAAIQTVPVIMYYRLSFYYQQLASYFRPTAYFVSYLLVTGMFAALETIIFSMIVYPMTGLHGGFFSSHHWYFILVCITLNINARAIAFCVCHLVPTTVAAQALVPLVVVMSFVFNGFLVPRNSIPSGWAFVHYSSFLTYSFRGLCMNEAVGLEFYCRADEVVPPPNPQSALPPPLGFANATSCAFLTGENLLSRYDMYTTDPNEKWTNYGLVIATSVVAFFCTWLAVVFVKWYGEIKLVSDDEEEEEEEIQSIVPAASVLSTTKHNVDNTKGLYLEFEDLTYTVTIVDRSNKKGGKKYVDKPLLTKVYGYAPPGKLIALMGASGAGKTTLLDVLAGKKTEGRTEGNLLLNNQPKDQYFNRYVGYVEQVDSHVETATVREAIMFSALLRLPSEMSFNEKKKRVEKVMETLELTPVADERIGNVAVGGLAPELRKKVTIAVELVTDPGILFLDEPTTGLSAVGALSVVQAVRRLANEISVVCTVHQPSQEIVDCFDWLLLLQKGGRVAYFGPKENLASYFERIGLGKCEVNRNVADYALDALGQRSIELESHYNPDRDPAELFLHSPEGQDIQLKLKEGVAPKHIKPPTFDSNYASTPLIQFVNLVKRTWVGYTRDVSFPLVRWGTAVFMGLLIGLLYLQLGHSQTDASSRVSVIFFSLLYNYFSATSVIPIDVAMRPIFFREKHSNMYAPLTYFTSRLVADVPLSLVQSFIYTTIFYWISGLRSDDLGIHYGQYLACFFVVVLIGYALSQLAADSAPNAEAGAAMVIVLLNIMMLFTGFLIIKSEIPRYWVWMFYFNVIRYPLFYLVRVELQGLDFECKNNDGAVLIALNPSNSSCNVTPQPVNDLYCYRYACPVTKGDQLLDRFSIDNDLPLFFGVTVAFYCGLRILNMLALSKLNFIKR